MLSSFASPATPPGPDDFETAKLGLRGNDFEDGEATADGPWDHGPANTSNQPPSQPPNLAAQTYSVRTNRTTHPRTVRNACRFAARRKPSAVASDECAHMVGEIDVRSEGGQRSCLLVICGYYVAWGCLVTRYWQMSPNITPEKTQR